MQTPDLGSTDPEKLAEFFETKLEAECDVATVIDRLEGGEPEFTLLDVRDPESFEEGHVEGAVNVPAEELEDRVDELDRDGPVWVYCYDHECMLSAKCAHWLAREGFQVRDVLGGWEDLEAKGAPVEEGARESAAPKVGGHN